MGAWILWEADTPQCSHCGMWMPFAFAESSSRVFGDGNPSSWCQIHAAVSSELEYALERMQQALAERLE